MTGSPLFPPLPADVRSTIRRFSEALDTVLPLRSTHRSTLPRAVAELSVRLTRDRASLFSSYWSAPRLTSAYLRYFLPWNLLRLTRLLGGLALPDPTPLPEHPGDTPVPRLMVDLGSGPLTLPLALWIMRPQWRQLPLTILCLDTSPHPLELGKALFTAIAGADSPWTILTRRASVEHFLREAVHTPGVPWLCSAVNMLNELKPRTGQDAQKQWGSFLAQAARFINAPEASLLLVEPGTRLGGTTLQRLRAMAMEEGLTPLAPCPHSNACPLLGSRTWCHFTFPCGPLPDWLSLLSRQAGLEKTALSLSFLILRTHNKDEESISLSSNHNTPAPLARVISAPFPVFKLQGQARYACTARGLTLLANSENLPSGTLTTLRWPDAPARDRKSGAWILFPHHYEHAAHTSAAGGSPVQEQIDMTFKKHREFSSGSDITLDKQHKSFHRNSDKDAGNTDGSRSSFARNERKRFEERREGIGRNRTFLRDRREDNFPQHPEHIAMHERSGDFRREKREQSWGSDNPAFSRTAFSRNQRDDDTFGNIDPHYAKKRDSLCEDISGQRRTAFGNRNHTPYGEKRDAFAQDGKRFPSRRRDSDGDFQRRYDREGGRQHRPYHPFDDGQRQFGERDDYGKRSFHQHGNRDNAWHYRRDDDSFGNIDPNYVKKRKPFRQEFNGPRDDRVTFGSRNHTPYDERRDTFGQDNKRFPSRRRDSDGDFQRRYDREGGRQHRPYRPFDDGQRQFGERDDYGKRSFHQHGNRDNAWHYRRDDDSFGNMDPNYVRRQRSRDNLVTTSHQRDSAAPAQDSVQKRTAERRFSMRSKVRAPRFRSREEKTSAENTTLPVQDNAVKTEN